MEMLTETSKEKSGGMAYEVILKPATTDTVQRPPSPPKERPVSQEIIEKKLKDAEERRQVKHIPCNCSLFAAGFIIL